MFVTGQMAAFAVLIPLVTYFGAKWLFKKDTEKENRRRAAGQMAGVLKSYGLVYTPEFLIDYAVGDYSGMGEKLYRLTQLFMSGEEAVIKEFSQVFDRLLTAKLKTEEGRALLAAKLADVEKAVEQPATV